jgi:hypothetical protein
MFGWFLHLVDTWFASIHLCVWVKSSPILSCNVFHFHVCRRYFWPDFWLHDLRSFSLIPSVNLSARASLIIYLQAWSESMALAYSISWISLCSRKTLVFEFIQNEKENLWIWENLILGTCLLCWRDPCVPVSSDLVSYIPRIKFRKKGAEFGRKIVFLRTSNRTMSEIPRQCPTDSFCPTFVHCFGRILLIECPFDPILFPIAL